MAEATWRDNVGLSHVAAGGGGSSFDVTTVDHEPQIGDYLVAWHSGWQGNFTQGAATSGASTPEDGAMTELGRVREPGNNHVVEVYLVGPLAAAGHRTVTFVPYDAGSAGTWEFGVCSVGALAASDVVDVFNGRDDQAGTPNPETNASGVLEQADEFAMAWTYPVDCIGQTIDIDPTWTSVASKTTSENYSVVRKHLHATTSITHEWELDAGGGGSGFNPLQILLTLKVDAGGGGSYVSPPQLRGGLSALTGGMLA